MTSPDQGMVPPQNQEMEQAVLGAVLVRSDAGPLVAGLVSDAGLKPEHFCRKRHELIFRAMISLVDQGDPVDPITVGEQLASTGDLEPAGGASYVHSLLSLTHGVGNHETHARTVIKHAQARDTIAAARELIEAVHAGDQDGQADAERRLLQRDTLERRTLTTEQRTSAVISYVKAGKSADWRWPFSDLNNMTGGMFRGHFTVLIGHSGHGKSVFADQILERCTSDGARCCAYLTEMTELERDLRFVARAADLPFHKLRDASLDEPEQDAMVRALGAGLPFEIEQVGLRKAPDIARHIRRKGWDVCVIDLLNVVTGREVKDIDDNIGMLTTLASETGTHIIGCQHLNRTGFDKTTTYPPEPTIGMIRGSGAIHDLSTNVLSVYRYEKQHKVTGDPTGEPGADAQIRFLKIKNGTPSAMPAVFNGNRMRFLPAAVPGTVGAAA